MPCRYIIKEEMASISSIIRSEIEIADYLVVKEKKVDMDKFN
jgi:hypothetical protein